MANHKRRRPKNRRAGCLLCKPHKANGVKKRKFISGIRPEYGVQGSTVGTGTWRQEAQAQLNEIEQIFEMSQIYCDENNDWD